MRTGCLVVLVLGLMLGTATLAAFAALAICGCNGATP